MDMIVSLSNSDQPSRIANDMLSLNNLEPVLTTLDPSELVVPEPMPLKTFKRTWDSDRALKSTYKGLFGKYQIRAYILLALGYGVIGAFLAQMPTFALLQPKFVDCRPYNPNTTNVTLTNSTGVISTLTANNSNAVTPAPRRQLKIAYNYSKEYGRTVLTDFNGLCDKSSVKLPYIMCTIGLMLGALILGFIADFSGRKMTLIGSLWLACALSVFQLLSNDYISYVFFMLFVGIAIGAVQVIAVPFVMEMFPIRSRALYGLSLLGVVFLLDLVMPWLALAIKHWKILQAVVTAPLLLTAALYWYVDETIFWHTARKDYVAAITSLKQIAKYNQVVFEDIFREAREFLRGKCSKGVQCDFQPLLRLEDIETLGTKYPDFDMVDLHATNTNKTTMPKRVAQILSGHHYNPRLSTFYPTDFLHSSILTVYLLIMCGLWLVSSLTEYSLDAPQLTQYLTDNFFLNYFLTHLIQIASFVIAFPLIYIWGRRWPTFCFCLIAEVCLLGSVAVKLDNEQARSAMLAVYVLGKWATRAAYLVIVIYTCEIFPTGLRCTLMGVCYTFRLIGIALASPAMGELNDWMHRLIYGVLALILGSMALLLPETKKIPLPRTMLQIESISTGISDSFRHYRSSPAKRNKKFNGTRTDGAHAFNDNASVASGARYYRSYDPQSTLHSIYELQDFAQDDTIHSLHGRYISRRSDPHSSLFYQPHSILHGDLYKQGSIAEDVEYDDDMNDNRGRFQFQQSIVKQNKLAAMKQPSLPGDDVIVLPVTAGNTTFNKSAISDLSSDHQLKEDVNKDQRYVTAAAAAAAAETTIETTTAIDEDKQEQNVEYVMSSSPKYQRAMSQDENYFSEHC